MNRTALGFVSEAGCLPQGLAVSPLSEFHVLSGAKENLETELARLSALQACFDAGLDVVPIAPRRAIPCAAALGHARKNQTEILRSLSEIAGKGQISLSLQRPATDRVALPDGRVWLADRTRERKRVDDMRIWLEKVCETAAYRFSPIQETRLSIMVGLLVCREDHSRALDHLKRIIAQPPFETPVGLRLSVTGLWTPLSFVDMTLTALEEAP